MRTYSKSFALPSIGERIESLRLMLRLDFALPLQPTVACILINYNYERDYSIAGGGVSWDG